MRLSSAEQKSGSRSAASQFVPRALRLQVLFLFQSLHRSPVQAILLVEVIQILCSFLIKNISIHI